MKFIYESIQKIISQHYFHKFVYIIFIYILHGDIINIHELYHYHYLINEINQPFYSFILRLVLY
ncbi:hypothetical protein EAE91_18805 [Photorhabdus noenieputensis]|nr:hypothetical protein [Photorhabdus noenieputensis]